MLLPRFSIRTLLAILTGVAVLSLLAGHAMGGRAWALGVTVAAASVPAMLAVHAGFFAAASLFARWLGPVEIVARTSRGGVEQTVLTATPTTAVPTTQQLLPDSTTP